MSRRILIVTSSYAPTMIADMHRARHLAWELPKLGWTVEILCPGSGYQVASYLDEDSSAFFPTDTPIHFVPEVWRSAFKLARLNSIGWRAIVPMLRVGNKLLQDRKFDLVYISTAKFPLFLLGPAWQKRFGVPFVLDFHDPCYKEFSFSPSWAHPTPKHVLASCLSKYIESRAASKAAGLVSVSPAYIEILRRRYSKRNPRWLRPGRQSVIPFAALPRDLQEAADGLRITSTAKDPLKIVYVGVGGPVMLSSFEVLCRTLCHVRSKRPDLVNQVRIQLYGTMLGWRDGEPLHLANMAQKWGMGDLVNESPGRVSYRRSLELLLESDGVLILGVDDPAYMPSKLFSYALSGKPLLAALHRDGPAFAQFRKTPGFGHAVWFNGHGEMAVSEAISVLGSFLEEVSAKKIFDRRKIIEPFLAAAMARRHVDLFGACMQGSA
jgi:Glycosyltransferase Family 4